MSLIIPIQNPTKVDVDKSTYSDSFVKIVVSPMEPGYGITVGNTIRRVLLSSIQGAAVKFVMIEGLHHEFTGIPGTDTDYVDFILRLKRLAIKSASLEDVTLELNVSKLGVVTAGDISTGSEVEIINKDLELFEVTEEGKEIRCQIIVGVNRGFVPSEEHDSSELPVGFIAVDSLFNPVKNVSFIVENERVGKRIDFDKLVLEVTTDGSIDPKEAFYTASKLLRDFYDKMIRFEVEPEYVEKLEMDPRLERIERLLDTSVNEMELSVRSSNCLLAAKIETVRDLVSKTENQMLRYRNFGKKSLDEIKKLLSDLDLSLGMNLEKVESEIQEARNKILKR